ncbi:alanine/glycine:cation symporter family protein [Inediibacterium massiliense]|uniref:alanine/glycine:cation symporter family protein n=1 Tax=Inediibacterium massiliense TaxID=1658111 RepID=UPI000A7E5357|nr:amino acid carrier protein [Inediibacterium massiliense]
MFLKFLEVLVWEYMWGVPLIVIILGAGLYFTISTNFFQCRYLSHAFRKTKEEVFKKNPDKTSDGVVSPLQAMNIAIGTTVGVGNIGGVATAIAFGGPGAIFWMWVAGLVGQIIKMTEITLAVHYRSKNTYGYAYGGPNYYMQKGIGAEKKMKSLYHFLSFLFAFGFLVAFFINIQTYTVAEAIADTFNINMITSGIIYTVLLYIMIAGGLTSLGKIASILVPFMVLFYLSSGLFIIFKNIVQLPYAFELIFKSAFTGTAATGGFAGAAFSQAIKVGMSRSVFSNEAGWGSAPMIHASAKTNHPINQGILGVFEVFIDTFVICSITALTIIMTGQWSSGLDGATLTLSAFEVGIGTPAKIIIAIGVFLFGLTTSSGIYAQMEVVVRYLVGENKKKDLLLNLYKWLYPIPSLALVFIAVYYEFPGTIVWLFSDASSALPIFANVIALVLLFPRFMELLKDYKAKYLGIGKVDPDFKVFYEDRNKLNTQKFK